MTVEHRYIEGDGTRLHVARAGKGPPVILLHGFPENWTAWRHQMPALVSAGFSVWAPDLRGYNRSDKPRARSAYRLQHLIADVDAIVRATGHSRAHIVGHDWGGIIAWTFAGAYPERTEKLVILNAPHMRTYLREVRRSTQAFLSWYIILFQLPFLPEWLLSRGNYALIRTAFRRMPARQGAFSESQIEEYIAGLDRPGALRAAINYYRANLRGRQMKLASSVRVSADTLVIWGERDPALSTRLLRDIEEVAPRVTVHRIPTAGHWLQNEAPDEVNRLMLDFLGSGRTAG